MSFLQNHHHSHVNLEKLYEIKKNSLKSDFWIKSYETIKFLPTAVVTNNRCGRSNLPQRLHTQRLYVITAVGWTYCSDS